MAAWWVAPLISGAVNIGTSLLSKPKERKPDLSWIDKFISEQRKDIASGNIAQMISQQAQRPIATATERAREHTEYQSVRTGTAGTGVDASQRLQIAKSAQTASGEAGVQAAIVQAQADEQRKARIEDATMLRDRLMTETRERYEAEKDAWKRQLLGAGLQTAAGFATAGLTAHLDAKGLEEQWQSAEALAKAQGFTEDLRTLAPDPRTALQIAGIEVGKEQGRSFMQEIIAASPHLAAVGFNYRDDLPLQQNMQIFKAHIEGMQDSQQKAQALNFVNMLEAIEGVPEANIYQAFRDEDIDLGMMDTLRRVKASLTPTYDPITMVRYDEQGRQITSKIHPEGERLTKIVEPKPLSPVQQAKQVAAYNEARIDIANWTKNFEESRYHGQYNYPDGQSVSSEQLAQIINSITPEQAMNNYADFAELIRQYAMSLNLPTGGAALTLGEGENQIRIDFSTGETAEERLQKARMKIYEKLLGVLKKARGSLEMTPSYDEVMNW